MSHRQLAAEVTDEDGLASLVISASKEIEPDARAMLLLAPELFRLDVTISGDTLRTTVRNLSTGALELEPDAGYPRPGLIFGEVEVYEPSVSTLAFALSDSLDRVQVNATIATLRFARRGTVRVTSQATVRRAPVAPART